jgi:transcriptional regulator with XRE-family HTH domain
VADSANRPDGGDDVNTLGDEIREARVRAGKRLRPFAEELELAPSYLSDIENDRRVPSEEVMKRIASKLRLDFDHLMALAGRFGEEAERYIKKNPAAGVLFRRISQSNLREEQLKKLLEMTEELKGSRELKRKEDEDL